MSDQSVQVEQSIQLEQLKSISNFEQVSKNWFRAGQPTQEEFQLLVQSGIKNIINLRPDSELDWNEKAFIEDLGISYHHLPINGAVDISFDNAQRLAELIESLGEQKTLVHCASSNRVGALVALADYEKNTDKAAAMEKGVLWGMKGLSVKVETLIEQ